MASFIGDIRYAFRAVLRSPGFACVAILTLALGIGISTTIFSLVNPILFRPLPFQASDRLVFLNESNLQQGFQYLNVSYADYCHWRRENRVFTDVGVYDDVSFTVTGTESPEHVHGAEVSATLFTLLGIQPIRGRGFKEGEDGAGSPRVALLSHGLWQDRFGMDPGIVGRTLVLNGRDHVVVGVMPPGFRFPATADLWIPIVKEDPEATHGDFSYDGIARLRPDVTVEQVRSDLAAIHQRLAREYPETNAHVTALVLPLHEHFFANVHTMGWVLLGAVGFVLAVACANVANLFLARAIGRQRELTIRAALGSGRWRTVRLLLAEALVLAVVAGALGLAVSLRGLDWVVSLIDVEVPSWIDFSVDQRVLGFTVALSLLTCLAFGLMPAWQVSRTDVQTGLKETGLAAGEGRGHHRLRRLLVASEVALVVLLLSGAGLMLRTLLNLEKADPGFNPSGRAIFRLDLPDNRYDEPADRVAFFGTLMERLAGLPGVQSAAAISKLPLSGRNSRTDYLIEGRPIPAQGQAPVGNLCIVTPGYFGTMEIPLLQGRDFSRGDTAGSAKVIIIDASLARQFFANDNPLGGHIKLDALNASAPWLEIVGVAGDVRHYGLDKAIRPGLYVPLAQEPRRDMTVVLHTATGDPLAVLPAVRQALRELDGDLPLYDPTTMDEVVYRSFWGRRFLSELFGLFSVFALALAAVGIAGVVAYSVAQRTQEIGVRMALGAQTADVLQLIVHQGMVPVLAGLGIGLAASLGLTRVLSSQLYGVSPWDPASLCASMVVFGVVALLACYIPARRAARIDPMKALRCE